MGMNKMKRRDFLKLMGWSGAGATLAGCDMPSYVTLKQGDEDVVAYLVPEEFVIPGVGVWYASTCRQCPAGCGLHGRVREGRVLKLEGNPESAINAGKLCQMGQAGLQGHYNPDRVTQPRARKNGAQVPVSWDEALELLDQKVGPSSGLKGDRFAWFTDTVSGHQAVLLNAHLESVGSKNHYVHEVVNSSVWQAVCRDMLGDAVPRLHIDEAKAILSFGADFLGTWGSPVSDTVQYASFRTASPRGVLVQVEPKMTLTGANADLWVPVRPGTEAVLALGIANVLATRFRVDITALPAGVRRQIDQYDVNRVTQVTGASGEHLMRIAKFLRERSPSLVLAGATVEGLENGYDTAAAIMVLNIILGNVGKTIVSGGRNPFPQLAAKTGSTRDLLAFAKALDEQSLDVVFFHGANPLYTAPDSLGIKEKLAAVPFKVAFSVFEDETAAQADLVLPVYSALEDWGTHLPAVQRDGYQLGIQQPLMEPLYADSRGFGDLLLTLLKMRKAPGYDAFDGYYAYLQKAFVSLPGAMKGTAGSDKEFWNRTLQHGVLKVSTSPAPLAARVVSFDVSEGSQDSDYPFTLVPSARLGLWDGRHANIPWLQEAPDQISKVVWDSWAEIHPRTAERLGVKNGDAVRISSASGTIEAKVYVYKGIHPDVIAVPLGQGHESYGRYAKDDNGDVRGVNPLKILDPVVEKKTGELALAATRVQVTRATAKDYLVRMGGSDTQVGRKLVATVTAEVFQRTEGDA